MGAPGHIGVKGNTTTDELGAKITMIGPELSVGNCDSLLNSQFKTWTEQQHTGEWKRTDRLRQAKASVNAGKEKSWGIKSSN